MEEPESGFTELSDYKASRTVRDCLLGPYFTSVQTLLVSGVAPVLANASIKKNANTATEILENALDLNSLIISLDEITSNRAVEWITNALDRVFAEATKTRERTGGPDAYFGLRHVLFEIFTSPDPLIEQERHQLTPHLRSPVEAIAVNIADYCQKFQEKGEDPAIWTQVIAERPILQPSIGTALPAPDDPWIGNIEDCNETSTEANAFAATIVSKKFQPPLAVAILGEWGAGKSFFMRQIHDAILRQCQNAKALNERADDEAQILENVVPVRFNAWHYAETNLWASLVDHIFTTVDDWVADNTEKKEDLDDAENRLHTAQQLTLEAIRDLTDRKKEADRCRDAHKAALAEQQEKETDLQSVYRAITTAAWDTVKSEHHKELENTAKTLGIDDVGDDLKKLEEAAATLRSGIFAPGPFRNKALYFLPLVLLLGLSMLLLLQCLPSEFASNAITKIAAFTLPLAGSLSALTFWLSKTAKTVQNLRTRYDRALAAEQERQRAILTQADIDLQHARQEADDAAGALTLAHEQLVEAKKDFALQDGKARATAYIRSRAASGEYEKQLSFIATIRRDFEQLSHLMTGQDDPRISEELEKQHTAFVSEVERLENAAFPDGVGEEWIKMIQPLKDARAEAPQAFDRIVLFIDDLDRCPSNKVVEVLEAIHMLLAYPLFTVFAAVDVRWLRKSLLTRYQEHVSDVGDAAQASPMDYLEKIFQVPYWVKRLDSASVGKLLEKFASEDVQNIATKPTRAWEFKSNTGTNQSDIAADGRWVFKIQQVTGVHRDMSSAHLHLQLQVITEKELIHMKELSGLLTRSPRRALRFVNSYRILKAGLSQLNRNRLDAGESQQCLSLLAINIHLGDRFPTSTDRLFNLASKESTISEALAKLNFEDRSTIQHWARIVSRYSFQSPLN